MLAAGWRAVHYVSAGVYEESGDWEAKCRYVPHAGLRRTDDGNALANAKAWSRAFSSSSGKESRGKNSRERSDRCRSGDSAGRDVADPAGPRRDDVRRILAARAGGDGALRDERLGSAGQLRNCAGRL